MQSSSFNQYPPSGVEISDERLPMLLLCKWNNTMLALSWTDFLGARYWPEVENPHFWDDLTDGSSVDTLECVFRSDIVEQIELTFASQTILLQCVNLKPLMVAIADTRLRVIREIPQDFIGIEKKGGSAVIVAIDVYELGEDG